MLRLSRYFNKIKLDSKTVGLAALSIVIIALPLLYLAIFKGLEVSKIFDIKRIFQGTPGPLFNYYTEFIVFSSAILLAAIVVFIYRQFFVKDRVTRKYLKRVRKFLFSFSFWVFLWVLLRWQKVYIFSSRAILYLIAMIYLIRLIILLRYYFFNYKKELESYKKEQDIKRYIPKKKKRNK